MSVAIMTWPLLFLPHAFTVHLCILKDEVLLKCLRSVLFSRPLFKTLGLISDLEAFLLGLVSVPDWTHSGLLIERYS